MLCIGQLHPLLLYILRESTATHLAALDVRKCRVSDCRVPHPSFHQHAGLLRSRGNALVLGKGGDRYPNF